jgi:carboxypeptidase D
MVPYDLPQVSHDMMLRFMGLDITQLASGSANVPSKVGNDTKPALHPAKPDATATSTNTAAGGGATSAEQNKAMWDGRHREI